MELKYLTTNERFVNDLLMLIFENMALPFFIFIKIYKKVSKMKIPSAKIHVNLEYGKHWKLL